MKAFLKNIFLGALTVCLVSFAGCKKDTLPDYTETVLQTATTIAEETQPSDVSVSEQDTAVTFDYEPGSMGVYVKADPNIEVDPETLDNISMTLSDKRVELVRKRVSDRQFDFVKSGHQVGGFLLVDIPRDLLENAPESWENFECAVDYIAKQVMPDIYPAESYISGGGHLDFGFDMPTYMTFMIQTDNREQYIHNIYIGEKYIYDFWHDTAWLADSGETIMSTLSAEDIKPELNQADSWSVHDFPDFPGVPRS